MYSPFSRFWNSYLPSLLVVVLFSSFVSLSLTISLLLFNNITEIFDNNSSPSSLLPFLFASTQAVPDILNLWSGFVGFSGSGFSGSGFSSPPSPVV